MPHYNYTAIDDYGKTTQGTLVAGDEEELATNLSQMGYYLLTATAAKEKKKGKAQKGPKRAFYIGKVKSTEVITFTHHLSTVLSAGIPIIQGLDDLVEQTRDARFKGILTEIRDDVQAGSNLSNAMAKHPKEFPPMVVRMVEIGEISGQMDKTLQKVSEFYDREIPQTVKKVFAAFEPIMILILAGIVLLVAVSMYLPLYSSLGKLGQQ